MKITATQLKIIITFGFVAFLAYWYGRHKAKKEKELKSLTI